MSKSNTSCLSPQYSRSKAYLFLNRIQDIIKLQWDSLTNHGRPTLIRSIQMPILCGNGAEWQVMHYGDLRAVCRVPWVSGNGNVTIMEPSQRHYQSPMHHTCSRTSIERVCYTTMVVPVLNDMLWTLTVMLKNPGWTFFWFANVGQLCLGIEIHGYKYVFISYVKIGYVIKATLHLINILVTLVFIV